jgi:hypothetical protein
LEYFCTHFNKYCYGKSIRVEFGPFKRRVQLNSTLVTKATHSYSTIKSWHFCNGRHHNNWHLLLIMSFQPFFRQLLISRCEIHPHIDDLDSTLGLYIYFLKHKDQIFYFLLSIVSLHTYITLNLKCFVITPSFTTIILKTFCQLRLLWSVICIDILRCNTFCDVVFLSMRGCIYVWHNVDDFDLWLFITTSQQLGKEYNCQNRHCNLQGIVSFSFEFHKWINVLSKFEVSSYQPTYGNRHYEALILQHPHPP